MKYIYIIIAIVIILIVGFKYDGNEYVTKQYYYDANDISQINFDLDNATIEFLPSEFDEIAIEIVQTNNKIKDNNVFIDEASEQLTIKEEQEDKFKFFGSGFKQNKIRIYVPQDKKDISFNVVGNTLKLNASNLSINQLIVTSDDLNVTLDGVVIQDMDTTTNTGKFNLSKSEIDQLAYVANTSSISFNDDKINYAIIDLKETSDYHQVDSRIKELDILGETTAIDLVVNKSHVLSVSLDNEMVVQDPFTKTATGFEYISQEYENKLEDVINQQYNFNSNKIVNLETLEEE